MANASTHASLLLPVLAAVLAGPPTAAAQDRRAIERREAAVREAPTTEARQEAAAAYRDAVARSGSAEREWPLTEAESELCKVLAAEKSARVGPYRRAVLPHLLVLAPTAWFERMGATVAPALATLDVATVLLEDLTAADFHAARNRRLIVVFTPDRGGGSAQTLEGVVFAALDLLGPPLNDQILFSEFGHELFPPIHLRPRFETWNEMWPELGRQYVLWCLGRCDEFEQNRQRWSTTYRESHLGRGLPLELLGPYDPGAGFLQCVVDATLRRGDRYDLEPLRAMFRRLQAIPAETDSFHVRQELLGWAMVKSLGDAATPVLQQAGFDLAAERLPRIADEARAGSDFMHRLQTRLRGDDLAGARALLAGMPAPVAASGWGAAAHAAMAAALTRNGDAAAASDALRRGGWIVHWQVLGPFANPRGGALDAPLPPELAIDLAAAVTGRDGAVRWRAVDAGTVTGYVDLAALASPAEETIYYATIEFRAGAAGEADLFTGSDDQLVVFMNGEKVAMHPFPRGAFVDNDRTRIRVKKGDNRLLLKVGNLGGGCGFLARLADRDGRPWPLP